MPKQKTITVSMPDWAYNTIIETLEVDAQSKAFDRELRNEIKKAIESIDESPAIAAFGQDVLRILEINPEWSSETTDEIAESAFFFELAETDDEGLFKAK